MGFRLPPPFKLYILIGITKFLQAFPTLLAIVRMKRNLKNYKKFEKFEGTWDEF